MERKEVKIVIGSNFGDEGKGLMADYFCRQFLKTEQRAITVMSNGGAQRGHTVVTPTGERHVFKHFASGTFALSDTYYPENFILNPMEFCRELKQIIQSQPIETARTRILLDGWSPAPVCFANAKCRWSTPYDVILNQIVEECREEKRHGSCGMGIWETIARQSSHLYPYTFQEFCILKEEKQISYLKSIRDEYFINRLKRYGIPSVPSEWKSVVYSPELMEHFLSDVKTMAKNIYFDHDYKPLTRYNGIVFENGQGLLLDQNMTLFGENTTPSNTGCLEPVRVIEKAFGKSNRNYEKNESVPPISIELCYVTRTYVTRHGAGRFDEECSKDTLNPNMNDKTNVTNPFQGVLRYGELNPTGLQYRIHRDLDNMAFCHFPWKAGIALTHTDEYSCDLSGMDIPVRYYSDGETSNNVHALTRY